MKQIDFSHINLKREETYADLVNKTARLINKPYIATLRMVEKWEPGQLDSLYNDCMSKWRDLGFNSPSHMWWTRRKKLKKVHKLSTLKT